jgi:hypothetical protein
MIFTHARLFDADGLTLTDEAEVHENEPIELQVIRSGVAASIGFKREDGVWQKEAMRFDPPLVVQQGSPFVLTLSPITQH